MISMVDREWVKKNFSDQEIHLVATFMGKELKVMAANATEILYEGVIVVEWSLTSVVVPLLVTKYPISEPILRNNVIEHIITNGTELEELETSLGVKRGVVEALATIIKKKEEDCDYLAEVKNPTNVRIPAGMRKCISC